LIAQFYGIESNEDELVYLMIHMNRLYEKNVRRKNDD
jgi:beta-glucoside operon transcriptional antiterminator